MDDFFLRAVRLARRDAHPSAPAGQTPPHADGFSFEGRRGKERRAALLRSAPDEVPPMRQHVADPRERAKQTRAEDRERLLSLVDHAAHKGNAWPQVAVDVLSWFFQGVVEDLIAGRCVVLPGIGAFCPRPSRPHGRRRQRLYVAFAAARNLSVAIAEHARFDPREYQRWETYRHNHRPSARGRRAIAQDPRMRVRRAWAKFGPSLARRRRQGSIGPLHVQRHDPRARESGRTAGDDA